jgi:hypothetical protein
MTAAFAVTDVRDATARPVADKARVINSALTRFF